MVKFNLKFLGKKASLNLSIEAIVIVVIAFVVLGLGLGFVKGQFGSMEDTSNSVQESVRQQILDDLRTSNNKLSFPATDITLETGEMDTQAIGIKNTEDSEKSFLVKFQVKSDSGFVDFVSEKTTTWTTSDGISVSARLGWDDYSQVLGAGDNKVVPVSITAPDKTGNYLFKVVVTDETDGSEYDSKTFFIKTT
ncbi:hypothetical protein HN385_02860 [archaeon]|jgi:hypothetical protein|nr:hypothetical protein [archaeon]MBT3450567.1 hypothetical protein [archaeon]MBT6868421.1 hypothetical protein [archaeon]MBT7193520.1 hypothetical protein [archaeon]MBT7381285.1 hypothetical protein [archaeon]